MKKKIMLSGPVTDVAYSPDGKYLVSADGNRKGKNSLIFYRDDMPTYWGEYGHVEIMTFDYSF